MVKYYVTTSIPYVNAEPHIGFAMELCQADVLARWARQRDDDVIFSTGTDEHGGKVADKAKEANQSTKQFTDQVSQRFKDLVKLLNISADRFIRTTDKGHEQRSQLIWQRLQKDIYKGKYEGWYCQGDEAFFTDQEVKASQGVCPVHKTPFERIREENYFFKLSAYQDQVAAAIKDDSFKVVPRSRRNEILSLIESGLEDISVSRPKTKIAWGIPVPGDKDQVMYVWFEALMNYITVIGYPEAADFNDYWPANVQVVGKDILRFHAAIWPAMLLSLGLKLPKMLYVHGHITVDDHKMSKSLGNVVKPSDIVSHYGADTCRYFLLRHIPSYEDGDFSWQRLEDAYNNELANELGNALQRTTAMINSYLGGKVGDLKPAQHDQALYEEAIENCKFDRALDEVWQLIRGLNLYIEEEQPWQLYKAKEIDHLVEVLSYQVSSLLHIAELLYPFMPETSDRIKAELSSGDIQPASKTLFPRLDELKSDA